MDLNSITGEIIGAAIDVHKEIGPGLLEGIYQRCLVYELESRGIGVEAEVPLPVIYKEMKFDAAYRADLIIDKKIIVELKAVDQMSPLFTAQLLSYLKMSSLTLGLLINFNVGCLTEGVKRVVNNY